VNFELFSIHPQTLRIEDTISFTVYYKSPENDFKIFCSPGDIYTSNKHGEIFDKTIQTLFVNKEDSNKYYQYVLTNLDIILLDPFIIDTSRNFVVYNFLAFLTQTTFENPDNKNLKEYKTAIDIICSFIQKGKLNLKNLIHMTSSGFQVYNHMLNVGIYGLALAKEIITDIDTNINEIAFAYFLHDIGKSTIPYSITNKKGPLSDEEWNIMKKHPEEGCRILQKSGFLTKTVETIIIQHHERHNGSGYPNKVKGDQIHLFSKICSIADAFEALTSNRPYRYAESSFNALAKIKKEMNKEFDPEFLGVFILLFSNRQIKKNLK